MLAYLLLGGVNDSLDHARALAGLARPHRCRVNLLPLHGGEGLPFVPSSEADSASFYKFLQGEGVRVFFRKSRGQDVGGACGQLVGRARDCDSGKGGVG